MAETEEAEGRRRRAITIVVDDLTSTASVASERGLEAAPQELGRDWGVIVTRGPTAGTWCQHTSGVRIETDERTARTIAILFADRARGDAEYEARKPLGGTHRAMSPSNEHAWRIQGPMADSGKVQLELPIGSTYNETIQADGDFLFVTDETTLIRVPKAVLLQVLRNAGWIP